MSWSRILATSFPAPIRSTPSSRRGSSSRLLGLDIGVLDHRPPLLDLGLLICGERFGRQPVARRYVETELGEALPHGGFAQGLYGSGIELGDDLLGCALGCPQAIPDADVERRQTSLGNGRNVGHRGQARTGRDGISADLAVAHVLQRI